MSHVTVRTCDIELKLPAQQCEFPSILRVFDRFDCSNSLVKLASTLLLSEHLNTTRTGLHYGTCALVAAII